MVHSFLLFDLSRHYGGLLAVKLFPVLFVIPKSFTVFLGPLGNPELKLRFIGLNAVMADIA
ncbi:hypothetical protein D3C87_2095670 [compost metagenome]